MAIRGSLREASLPDVLQLLSMGNKVGLLTIDRGDQVGRIFFDGGRIAYAEIEHRQLSAEEAVYVMFTWDDGAFNFAPAVPPPEGVPISSIDPQSVLLEGARRVDEWAVIEKKIHSLDLVFALERQELLRTKLELTAEQQALLPLIDGNRDVHDLIEESGLGEFVVGKELYGLITAGFVLEVGRSGALAKTVDNPDVDEHRNLGMAFYRAAMYDEAMAEFSRVLELREDDASAAFFVGLISIARRDWATAASAFQRATVYAADAISPLHNLSYALSKLGQADKARRVCDEALARTERREPVVLTWSGALAIQARNAKLANAELAAAHALWGDAASPPAVWFHHSALAAALEGDLEQAERILREAIDAHPHGAALYNNLAVVLSRRGRYEEAREAAEQGIAANASLPQLHANLGDVLLHTGMHAEAQVAYRRGRQSALR
jgi:tetratricopeptide (TPR) repeat protein